MPRDGRTKRARLEKARKEQLQQESIIPAINQLNNQLLSNEQLAEIMKSEDVLNKVPNSVLMNQLEKRIDDELVKNFITEVQRTLLTYPNTVLGNVVRPWLPRNLLDVDYLVKHEPVLAMVMIVLRGQLFRQGIQIKRRFWGKCDNKSCAFEYEEKPTSLYGLSEKQFAKVGEPCDVCDKGTLWPPDKDQKTILKDFVRKVNHNKESLRKVAEQCENDLNIFDNMYLAIFKKYDYDEKDELVSVVREIVRLDPIVMLVSADERGVIGNRALTCLFHRNFIIQKYKQDQDNYQYTMIQDKMAKAGSDQVNTENPVTTLKCPICGETRLYPVWYVATRDGSLATLEQAFIENEIIYRNRYFPGTYYGYSPVLVAWTYATSLVDMTKYIYDYFRNQQIPRGMLAVPGSPESVKMAKNEAVNQLHQNKHSIPWFNIPMNSDGKATAMPTFIPFVNTLDELQYTAVRDEFRLRATALYGVSPFMQNDTTQGSGLNKEDLQLTVTNERIETNQGTWNTKEDATGVFEEITIQIGVTDWILELPPPMEQDQMAPLERKEKKMDLALKMKQLNYAADLPEDGLTDENDFLFTKMEQQQNPFDPNQSNLNSNYQQLFSANSFNQKPANQNNNNFQQQQDSVDNKRTENRNKPGETDYQDTRNVKKTINLFNEELLKIDPVDKLANELYEQLTKYYNQLILIYFASKFANRDPASVHQMELTDSIIQMLKTAEQEVQNFGQNFAHAAFNLGKLLVNFNDESSNFHDQMPNITITGLLSIGAKDDTAALRAYEQANGYREAFSNFNLDISNQFRELVRQSLTTDKKTIDQLVVSMQNIVPAEANKLYRIARTEVTRFSNEGRVLQYKEAEQEHETQFKYIWFVNHDDRLSKICRTIEERVPVNGVSLDELKDIVIQVQHEMMSTTWQASWLAHPNCRSRPIRKV